MNRDLSKIVWSAAWARPSKANSRMLQLQPNSFISEVNIGRGTSSVINDTIAPKAAETAATKNQNSIDAMFNGTTTKCTDSTWETVNINCNATFHKINRLYEFHLHPFRRCQETHTSFVELQNRSKNYRTVESLSLNRSIDSIRFKPINPIRPMFSTHFHSSFCRDWNRLHIIFLINWRIYFV